MTETELTGTGPDPMAGIPPEGIRLAEGPMAPDAPDDPGVAVIRRFFAAIDAADRPAVRELLAEDVRWTVPGRSPVAGTHVGPDEVLDVDATLRDLSGGTLRHRVLIWLAAPPHAHAVTRQTATRDGVEASFDQAFVFTVQHGLITEIHAYIDDLYAYDDFWQQPAGHDDGPSSPGAPA